jgi:hypothetical protein
MGTVVAGGPIVEEEEEVVADASPMMSPMRAMEKIGRVPMKRRINNEKYILKAASIFVDIECQLIKLFRT